METVLLYYKYTEVENPEDLRESQFELCSKLGLKGRILIAKEGMNGTIGGSEESCMEYIRVTSNIKGFDGIDWKISHNTDDSFPKLKVVVRDEIVSFKAPVNLKNKAPYILPEEMKELLDKQEDVVILDARNNYESKIGKFKNAIAPDIQNFREFPEFVKTIAHLKDKPIVTYCTGGIRCEKASAYLIEQGFKDVRQLHGGIAQYGEKAGGKDFEGTIALYNKFKKDIYDLFTSCTYLDAKSLKATIKFLDGFYGTINNPKAWQKDFAYPCDKNGTGNVVIKGLKEDR